MGKKSTDKIFKKKIMVVSSLILYDSTLSSPALGFPPRLESAERCSFSVFPLLLHLDAEKTSENNTKWASYSFPAFSQQPNNTH